MLSFRVLGLERSVCSRLVEGRWFEMLELAGWLVSDIVIMATLIHIVLLADTMCIHRVNSNFNELNGLRCDHREFPVSVDYRHIHSSGSNHLVQMQSGSIRMPDEW